MKDIKFTIEEFKNHGYKEDGSFLLDETWGVPNFSNNKIKKMEKAINEHNNKPTIYFDLDGVLADFAKGYSQAFNRNAYEDDSFTVEKFCQQVPHFFRMLPVNSQGLELFNSLKDKYNIVFLTTPMQGLPFCKRDKIEWVKENIGVYDVIFSRHKANHVVDQKSILIDDMDYNLKPWASAGGKAIKFPQKNDKILNEIEETFNPKDSIEKTNISKKPVLRNLNTYQKGQEILFKGIPVLIEKVPGDIKWFKKVKYYEGMILSDKGNIKCIIGPENKSIAFKVQDDKGNTVILLGFSDMHEIESMYNSDKFIITGTKTKEIRESLI